MNERHIPDSLASLIEGLRWPLGAGTSPPLYMVNLDKMREIRKKTPHPVGHVGGHYSSLPHAMAQDVIGTVTQLTGGDTVRDTDQIHYARIAASLLLLGHGYTDESHALVSPLSWVQPTTFVYGPPVASSPPVAAMASFVHSLVHRREGFHDSEFGMTGFGNAHYWASSTSREAAVETLPLETIRKHVLDLASLYPDSVLIQEWVETAKGASVDGWESRLSHTLCERVMREDISDPALRDFAEKVSEIELRTALSQTLTKLGFVCENDCMRKF